MNKTQAWKIVLILFLVIFSAALVWPPQDKLKQGLDLGGGTSLIYDIDTTGLESQETKDLAQNMIPILLRRIDPTHAANIIMRPQGDTRIEILLPLSSTDTRVKRDKYENALEALETENLNLMTVKRALDESKAERLQIFAEFANDSEERAAILENLAITYDEFKAASDTRQSLEKEMNGYKEAATEVGLNADRVEARMLEWSKLDKKALTAAIDTYLKQNKPANDSEKKYNSTRAKANLERYVKAYTKWFDVVNELADSENGKSIKYKEASLALAGLNLSINQLTDTLELPVDSVQRLETIENMKKQFSDRAAELDATVLAYNEYQVVGGRIDDPEDVKRMLKGAGVLVFRILPTLDDAKANPDELQGYVDRLKTMGPKRASSNKYIWIELEDPQTWSGPGIVGVFGEKGYVLTSNQKNETMLQGGDDKWKLKKAYPTVDDMGSGAIGFVHDEVAARLFYNLTNKNVGRPLCIILDDVAITAPNISTAIRSSGIITGKFTRAEVDNMVNKLNAGSFPARLSDFPTSEKSVGATIGADNRDKGIKAGLIGLAAVAVFMVIYYLKAGLIANLALFLNLLFVLAMMVMLRATFTLPGIAGLILTIGMSVDANVLIFERIREEQNRGASLRNAIANGYQKAFSTIFDANITTFFVALILYMVASEEIKGFAIVLMLGIASSMFTALFVTRVVFNMLLNAKLIKDHLVMQMIIKKPNINWMGMRKSFFVISSVLIIGGLLIFVTRNEEENSKYDIEFTGGTSVQIDLKESAPLTRNEVENKIWAYLPGANVYTVGDTGLQYEITTTLTNETVTSLTFTSTGETAETITDAIDKAAATATGRLHNLIITADENGKDFLVSTSQVNKGIVIDILNRAFADKASVGEPVANEVVSKAVRDTFEDLLEVREDLGINIVSINSVPDSTVELADFLGGTQILCELDRSTTYSDLANRFKDIRFKPDMQDLVWYKYAILDTDLIAFDDDDKVTKFVYTSVHPEAGYRDLTKDELVNYQENEKSKIINATSLASTLSRVTQIDPSIGKQAQTQALVAVIMSLIAIVAYIWIRFGTARYGFAAIAALVHDVCITLGIVTACTYFADNPFGQALLIGDFKINLQIIAAFLTIIGYSLNDTIVVFDRIRENKGKGRELTPQIITNSINQTLSRTLLTSLTTFLVVLVMYIWGGTGLRGFTFALLIGVIVGTYSSIAIAAPILLIGKKNNSEQLRK
jgi:SecD/SecF fusion protein